MSSEPRNQLVEDHDFRLYLQNQFLAKCRKHPRYSLRAFAKTLKTDPSTLSQLLRGKRTATPATVLRLAQVLGLGPLEVNRFLEPLKVERTSTQLSQDKLTPSRDLTLDAFQVIADWYHYAIFELVTLKNFRPDTKAIALKLGITVTEAHCAIERLFRLGLLEKSDAGKWRQGASLISTAGNPFTAVAFRKLQAQVLKGALAALEEIPMEHRDQTSMTMAMNTRRIPEAKERIKKFRRELCAFLQEDADRDAVYQLGVSLYPLTRVENTKEKMKKENKK